MINRAQDNRRDDADKKFISADLGRRKKTVRSIGVRLY
jgi:hypothetical protein